MTAYYNELDAFAAQWLRNLGAAGYVAPGDVDGRDIREVQPNDLRGARQAHFFAGIGGWSFALRLAGWPDELPVWTGSCPCQPFSGAGRRKGFDDARHLWPEWFRLIRECRPPVLFGEQVASPDGYRWLDLVSADLEGVGYAFGAAVLPAAGAGAPHARHRLYFVGHALGERRQESGADLRAARVGGGRDLGGGLGDSIRVDSGRDGGTAPRAEAPESGAGCVNGPVGDESCAPSGAGGMANADGGESGNERLQRNGRHLQRPEDAAACGPWADLLWLPCRDRKLRPTQPGLFPLADGVSGRVGRLRAYGNAIVPQVAALFIRACLNMMAAPEGAR